MLVEHGTSWCSYSSGESLVSLISGQMMIRLLLSRLHHGVEKRVITNAEGKIDPYSFLQNIYEAGECLQ